MPTMTVRMASINVALLDTFRDETRDGLDRLEARLLELVTRRDPALVDALFRVVHTIKGGAGTFGMTEMTRLAHRMESVLDAYRNGAEPTRAGVTALLDGCDTLRRLLAGAVKTPEQDQALELRLEQVARDATAPRAAAPAQPPAPAPAPAAAAAPAPAPRPASAVAVVPPARDANVAIPALVVPDAGLPPGIHHTIRVSPDPGLFRAGVDPVMLFEQLSALGELSTEVDLSAVPPLAELDPMTCHLRWTLRLAGSEAGVVDGLFDWLGDLCPIAIETATEPRARAAPAEPPLEVAPAAPPRREPAARTPARPQQVADGASAVAPTIRVRLDKLDALMALVGELVVAQSTLRAAGAASGAADHRSRSALDELERLARALQQSALQLRSMPISSVLDRFPRLVHDLGARLGKEIALEIGGDTIELDKTVLERIGDPLVHLIRNCIDHGIEDPDTREAAGKPRGGRIQIAVDQRGDEVTIDISDDGRGLDPERILRRARERGLVPPGATLTEDEIHRLIFLPGFSTAEQVSDLSGRGVGMDVVVRTIHELGGDVQLRSRLGEGTTIALRLPLTLAIIDGQLVRSGGRVWIVPLSHVIECCQLDPAAITRLLGQRPLHRIGHDLVPMIDLCERMAIPRSSPAKLLLVVEVRGQPRALMIDELGPRQQIVIKSLSGQLANIGDVAGATVLGDGSIAFILDIAALCGGERSAA